MKKTDLILDWNRQKQLRQLGFLLLILAALGSILAARLAHLANS
jgi:hypothetical protein